MLSLATARAMRNMSKTDRRPPAEAAIAGGTAVPTVTTRTLGPSRSRVSAVALSAKSTNLSPEASRTIARSSSRVKRP
jgi:hypothetical protein